MGGQRNEFRLHALNRFLARDIMKHQHGASFKGQLGDLQYHLPHDKFLAEQPVFFPLEHGKQFAKCRGRGRIFKAFPKDLCGLHSKNMLCLGIHKLQAPFCAKYQKAVNKIGDDKLDLLSVLFCLAPRLLCIL